MWELWSVFIPCLFLVYLSDQRSTYKINEKNQKEYVKKDIFFFVIAVIWMAAFVGLRTWYNDTVTYLQGYNMIDIEGEFWKKVGFSLGSNPGFWMTSYFLRLLGCSPQSFLMFFAIVTIVLYLWFIRKYTDNIWISVFFLFTMGCYTFTLAAIKQCVAVAICLLAVDKAIQKQWTPFVLWVLVAATFHPYALMYLVVPFLNFKPWSKKTYFLLVIFGMLGIGLQNFLEVILNITTMIGEEFNTDSFSGVGVNIFRLAVIWAPIILSFVIRKQLMEDADRTSNIIMNLSILNAGLMYVALFGTANYFARLANYFLIFQTIFLPRLFKYFTSTGKKIVVIITIGCYLFYFYYANAIDQPFDMQYQCMNLVDYFKSLL